MLNLVTWRKYFSGSLRVRLNKTTPLAHIQNPNCARCCGSEIADCHSATTTCENNGPLFDDGDCAGFGCR